MYQAGLWFVDISYPTYHSPHLHMKPLRPQGQSFGAIGPFEAVHSRPVFHIEISLERNPHPHKVFQNAGAPPTYLVMAQRKVPKKKNYSFQKKNGGPLVGHRLEPNPKTTCAPHLTEGQKWWPPVIQDGDSIIPQSTGHRDLPPRYDLEATVFSNLRDLEIRKPGRSSELTRNIT